MSRRTERHMTKARKHQQKRPPATTTYDPVPALQELAANEELVEEAKQVGLITMLEVGSIARRTALAVLDNLPYVEVKGRKNPTLDERLEASITKTRRELPRNDRYYKKAVEEGITNARLAVTVAKLAIDKRKREQTHESQLATRR